MDANIPGIIFIVIGTLILIRNPQIQPELQPGKVRGVSGPILIVLGILMVTGVLPGAA